MHELQSYGRPANAYAGILSIRLHVLHLRLAAQTSPPERPCEGDGAQAKELPSIRPVTRPTPSMVLVYLLNRVATHQ